MPESWLTLIEPVFIVFVPIAFDRRSAVSVSLSLIHILLLQAITMREVTKDLNEIAIKVNEAGIEGVCLDEQEE